MSFTRANPWDKLTALVHVPHLVLRRFNHSFVDLHYLAPRPRSADTPLRFHLATDSDYPNSSALLSSSNWPTWWSRYSSKSFKSAPESQFSQDDNVVLLTTSISRNGFKFWADSPGTRPNTERCHLCCKTLVYNLSLKSHCTAISLTFNSAIDLLITATTSILPIANEFVHLIDVTTVFYCFCSWYGACQSCWMRVTKLALGFFLLIFLP